MRSTMNRIKLLSVFFCILAIAACDTVDFGNINEDDDAPQEANVEGLMVGAMNRYFSSMIGRSYHLNPTLYVQYQTQSVYTTEMTYGQNPYPWERYYSGVLSNLNEVIEVTGADDVPATVEAFGDADNQFAVAEIFSAMVWKRLTDTWGPIPYTEALNGDENKTPAYSDQETIYKDLISRVKAARDMIDTGAAGPTGDILYGGDMEKWVKFANSLLLQMTIQLSEVDETYASTEFADALAHSGGVIEELGDEAWYDHQNSPGATNPFTANRGSDYFLSEPFTDALMGTTPNDSAIVYSNSEFDNRLNVLSDRPTASGGPYGIDKIQHSGSTAQISGTIWASDADLHYMTAAYTYLNRAEAAARGWTTEDANAMLTAGIVASYATFDGHYDGDNANDAAAEVTAPDFTSGDLQDDGTAFAAQRVLDAATADGGILQVIGEEKWVALFPMGFDAWSEWRRTGYPGLKPAPDATNDGSIPRRYIYPDTEGGANTENYNAALQMLSDGDTNTSRFWWDVN